MWLRIWLLQPACCQAWGDKILSVNDGRKLSSGVVALVVCAVLTDLLLEGCSNLTTADCHHFLAEKPVVLRRSCYNVEKKYGKVYRDLRLLRERFYSVLS